MQPTRRNKTQREAMQPFGEVFQSMYAFIVGLSDEELNDFADACRACSTTNCGWAEYAAATKFLIPEIEHEQRRRARVAKESRHADQ